MGIFFTSKFWKKTKNKLFLVKLQDTTNQTILLEQRLSILALLENHYSQTWIRKEIYNSTLQPKKHVTKH